MKKLSIFEPVRISNSKLMDLSGGAGFSVTPTSGNTWTVTDHIDAQNCTDFLDGKGHATCDSAGSC